MTFIDPMTEDPHVLDEREEDAIRQARWDAFRERTLEIAREYSWREVVSELFVANTDEESAVAGTYAWDVLQFQETEQLSGVLSCLAQARRQWEDDMNKTEVIR